MNSFKLVFAMVIDLSWKSTQIQIRFSWKSKQNIFFRFELSAGSYIIIPATFETGAASNFMIRVFSFAKLVMLSVDQVDLMMLTKMAVLTIVGAMEDVDKLDLVNWIILTKLVVLNKLALLRNYSPEKIRKLSSVITSALLWFSTII